MPDDQKRIANLQASVVRLGTILGALESFATEILAGARINPRLSTEILRAARDHSIQNLKNANVTGLSIDCEAETLRQAIEDAKQIMDRAIANGWQQGQC